LAFRAVVLATFIFSIPDFLGFIIAEEKIAGIKNSIPLATENMGWVLPAVIVFVGVTIIEQFLFPKRNIST
jgi:LIVCS family branched-chain amino acid:cation transporter